MLSAETASNYEIARQHQATNQRIRNSLVPVSSVHWDEDHQLSHAALPVTSNFSQIDQLSHRRLFAKSMLKSIQKFEIILDQRKKPVHVEEALSNFRRDSLLSLQDGTDRPSIKDYVDLSSEAYEPGDDVTGHIHVRLIRQLSIKEIAIKLKGVYLVAFEQKTEGESTTGTEQITFLTEDAAFDGSGSALQAGSYKYVFKFKLPLNIPGTMFFERFQTVYEGASVVYSIEAIIKLELNIDEFCNTPVAKEIIEVMKKLPERNDTVFHRACNVNKACNLTFCCYDMGKMSLGVTLDKLLYREGETIKINIMLSNDSKLKAREVVIELIQNSSFRSKTQKIYVLEARKVLMVQRVPLDNLGYGDAINHLILTLPDEMQASTVTNIVPPSSFFTLRVSSGQNSKTASKHLANKSQHDQIESNVNNSADAEAVDPDDVELNDATYLVLENDYHNLYNITYHLHIKLRSSTEWFNMKGPEIHFPITIESADSATRKRIAQQKQAQQSADDEESEQEEGEDI